MAVPVCLQGCKMCVVGEDSVVLQTKEIILKSISRIETT